MANAKRKKHVTVRHSHHTNRRSRLREHLWIPGRSESRGSLHSFDVQYSRHTLDGANHTIEVLHIKHFDGHLDVTSLVVNRSACVTNTCFHIRNRAGDPRDHSGAILSDGQQLHGVCCLLWSSRPLNFNDTFAIDHQLVDVFATL